VFDGRAGKRVMQLLRSERGVLQVLQPDLEASVLRVVPYSRDTFENYAVVYEAAVPGEEYILACDVAEGKEHGDFSLIKVLKRSTRSVVASYYSRYDETYVALVLRMLWDFYTIGAIRPWWIVETTGLGLTVFDQCVQIHEMTNAFMMQNYDTATETISHRKGWWTSARTRNVLIGELKSWLVESTGWVDQRCVRELTTFVRDKNGKPQAKPGCNDDEVMCWGMALQGDIACPRTTIKPVVPIRADGLARDPFHDFDVRPTLTTEEACFAQALMSLRKSQVRNYPLADYAA